MYLQTIIEVIPDDNAPDASTPPDAKWLSDNGPFLGAWKRRTHGTTYLMDTLVKYYVVRAYARFSQDH